MICLADDGRANKGGKILNAIMLGSLAGGIGLFVPGMWLMTDGLKIAAGNTLRSLLARWTGTPLRGIVSGALIASLVQSSRALAEEAAA